jgi:hypothetical protein
VRHLVVIEPTRQSEAHSPWQLALDPASTLTRCSLLWPGEPTSAVFEGAVKWCYPADGGSVDCPTKAQGFRMLYMGQP